LTYLFVVQTYRRIDATGSSIYPQTLKLPLSDGSTNDIYGVHVKLLAAKVPGHQLPQTFRFKSWLGLAQGNALICAHCLDVSPTQFYRVTQRLTGAFVTGLYRRFKPISIDIEDFLTKLLSMSAHSLTAISRLGSLRRNARALCCQSIA
jgi:hypothetical protein